MIWLISGLDYCCHYCSGAAVSSMASCAFRVVAEISGRKNEPAWMRAYRLKALEIFESKPMPPWGGDLSDINFAEIFYFVKASDKVEGRWEDVPQDIKTTFDRLGIPEAEKKFLAGVGNQYDSEVVYHSLHKTLSDQGVIFVDTDTALKEHPDLFKEYFGTKHYKGGSGII